LALPYVRRHGDPRLNCIVFGDAVMLVDDSPAYSPWLYLLSE
jgi:hypothetical protein